MFTHTSPAEGPIRPHPSVSTCRIIKLSVVIVWLGVPGVPGNNNDVLSG